jgi:hypothetical protein
MGLCDGKPINQRIYLVKYTKKFKKQIKFTCLFKTFVYKVFKGY